MSDGTSINCRLNDDVLDGVAGGQPVITVGPTQTCTHQSPNGDCNSWGVPDVGDYIDWYVGIAQSITQYYGGKR